jgi:hypothetical protein
MKPPSIKPPEFFIMSCKDMLGLMEHYKQRRISDRGRYDDRFGGFNWTAVFPHRDKWDVLPK